MTNPFRLLMSPLTKTVYAGRAKDHGGYSEMSGVRHDVTQDFMSLMVQYVGVDNCMTISADGEPMYELSLIHI